MTSTEEVFAVERKSDKHGPRVDEEMEHEVRSMEQGAPVPSRVEEHRETEPVDQEEDEEEEEEGKDARE